MAICYKEPKADLVVFFLYNILNGTFDSGRLSSLPVPSSVDTDHRYATGSGISLETPKLVEER